MRTCNDQDILNVFRCFGNRHWIAIVVQPAGSSNIAVRRTELARIVSNPTGPVAARTALHALTPQKRNHSAGVLSTCSRIFLISSLLVVEISFVMPGTYTVILSVALKTPVIASTSTNHVTEGTFMSDTYAPAGAGLTDELDDEEKALFEGGGEITEEPAQIEEPAPSAGSD